MSLPKTEPVALQGAVTTILTAAVAVLTAFDWWDPTEEQIGALAGILAALIAVGTAFARGRVWPQPHVEELVRTETHKTADRLAAVPPAHESFPLLPAPPRTVAEHRAQRETAGLNG